MKLADLRPCDGCGGPLFTPPGRFMVIRVSGALLGPAAAQLLHEAASTGVPLRLLHADRSGDPVMVLGELEARSCSFASTATTPGRSPSSSAAVRSGSRRWSPQGSVS